MKSGPIKSYDTDIKDDDRSLKMGSLPFTRGILSSFPNTKSTFELHKPIGRDKDNVPIERGSFFKRKSFDYSQTVLWESRGHREIVHMADLTFIDHLEHIGDDDDSI